MKVSRFAVLASLLVLLPLKNVFGQVKSVPASEAKARMDSVAQGLGSAFMQQWARVGLSIGITQNGRTEVV